MSNLKDVLPDDWCAEPRHWTVILDDWELYDDPFLKNIVVEHVSACSPLDAVIAAKKAYIDRVNKDRVNKECEEEVRWIEDLGTVAVFNGTLENRCPAEPPKLIDHYLVEVKITAVRDDGTYALDELVDDVGRGRRCLTFNAVEREEALALFRRLLGDGRSE